jgi:hypothetical protein
VAGGCHLNRPIAELVEASGLTLTRLDTYSPAGLPLVGLMSEGVATKYP